MDCQICGQPALPKAKLCAPCRQALKRARHDTVSIALPLMSLATQTIERRRARRAAARVAPAPSSSVPSVIPPPLQARRASPPMVAVAVAAVLCGVGYFSINHRGTPAPAPAAAASPEMRAAPASPSAASPQVATMATVKSEPDAEFALPIPAASTPLPRTPPAPARPRPAPAKLASVTGVGGDGIAGLVTPPEPAAVEMPAPPPVPREAPPPDRGQIVGAALAQCKGGDVLNTAICEQRARLQHCDGYWGLVPQCPAPRDTYGQ